MIHTESRKDTTVSAIRKIAFIVYLLPSFLGVKDISAKYETLYSCHVIQFKTPGYIKSLLPLIAHFFHIV